MIDGGAKSLADKTYNGLREDIMAGRIAPGSKLKLETLTGEYGVGMSPLREALGRLVGDLFEIIPELERSL